MHASILLWRPHTYNIELRLNIDATNYALVSM